MENLLDIIYFEKIENALKENKTQKVFGEEFPDLDLWINLWKKEFDEELNEVIENKFCWYKYYPALFKYEGKDPFVVSSQYSNLYKTFVAKGIENKIKLIYIKYGLHEPINFDACNEFKSMRDLIYNLLD